MNCEPPPPSTPFTMSGLIGSLTHVWTELPALYRGRIEELFHFCGVDYT